MVITVGAKEKYGEHIVALYNIFLICVAIFFTVLFVLHSIETIESVYDFYATCHFIDIAYLYTFLVNLTFTPAVILFIISVFKCFIDGNRFKWIRNSLLICVFASVFQCTVAYFVYKKIHIFGAYLLFLILLILFYFIYYVLHDAFMKFSSTKYPLIMYFKHLRDRQA